VDGLVDFHCHLDLYPDHAIAVRESEAAGVFTLAVTTTPRAWPRNNELATATRFVRAALGLHPQLVADRADELSLWDEYLPQTRYVGEVGLDSGPQFYKSLPQQKQVFEHVLRKCATAGDKIVTVHSVRSTRAVLDHIESFMPPGKGKVVLHWFTGTGSEARRAIELGCFFSVNAAMFGNDRRDALVLSLPLDRVLTETDGPFTRTANRPTRSIDVALAVDALAKLHGLDSKVVASTVRTNLRRLLE